MEISIYILTEVMFKCIVIRSLNTSRRFLLYDYLFLYFSILSLSLEASISVQLARSLLSCGNNHLVLPDILSMVEFSMY